MVTAGQCRGVLAEAMQPCSLVGGNKGMNDSALRESLLTCRLICCTSSAGGSELVDRFKCLCATVYVLVYEACAIYEGSGDDRAALLLSCSLGFGWLNQGQPHAKRHSNQGVSTLLELLLPPAKMDAARVRERSKARRGGGNALPGGAKR